jgi:photosystem II stability/assembly factor-like uncharacterized protein/phosphodiesterase/alkaline phosphatase D-like protein
MKKGLIVIALMSLYPLLFAQQWHNSPVPYARNVNAVKILKQDVIIAAGGNLSNDSIQALYRSDDGGLSWQENPGDYISSWIKSIAFADTLHGFGVGFNARMVYTSNGGYNWTTGSSPINRHLNKVIYLNAHSLIAVGGEPDAANSMQTIMKSVDGGSTWNVLYDQGGQWLRSVYFKDTLNGFAIGDSGVFLKTVNGGNAWTTVTAPVLRNWNDLTFINADTGYVVGGNDSTATILKTTDGGNSWALLRDSMGATLRCISFWTSAKGKIVGDLATLLASTDGGQSWQTEIVPNVTNGNFTSVSFLNDTFGVIGAAGGQEYIYSNSYVPDAFTTGVFYTDSTSAELTGLINTHGCNGEYMFYYSSDSTFASASYTNAAGINCNTLTQVIQNVYNLTPHTAYYYFLQATTLAGNVNASVLSFVIGNTSVSFSTTGNQTINDTTVQLLGLVKGFTYPLHLVFEYGTTPSFGDTISASPANVTDSLQHNVTGSLTHLQPLTRYFFRLRGTSSNFSTLLTGNTLNFFTGTAYRSMQANQVMNLTDSTATLNGSISGCNIPASLSFEYSIDSPVFDNVAVASPANVSDTFTHSLSANLNSLQSYHTYYYRLKAETYLGTFYSNVTTFFTGTNLALTVLPASAITSDSAFLSGYITEDTVNTQVWFEYGLNNVFSNSIAATPPTVAGNQRVLVTARLTGLLPYQQYVYRLKASNVQGTFYSEPLNFCSCPNEIPNWDFELWDHYNIHFPASWFIYGSASQVQSYDGSKAVLIQGTQDFPGGAVLEGFPQGPNQILYGFPFTARPDSMIFYANYNIQPGDTGIAFMALKNNGQSVASKFYFITGNSNNSFKRISFPITYSSGAVPDSIAVGFTSTNVFGQSNGLSWMVLDNVSFSGTSQNIPNPGFENWDSIQYDLPQRWIHKSDAPVNIFPVYPVTQTTDAHSGHYAVRLQNQFNGYGSASGSLYVISTNLQQGQVPGFTVSQRYRTLNGYLKYFPLNNDTALVQLTLYKNDHIVGFTSWTLDSLVPEYTRFSIPIQYIDSVTTPDSATLNISASYTQTNGASVLYVDDLGFDGFWMDSIVNSVPVITSNIGNNLSIRIYPNPADDVLFIKSMGEESVEATIEMYNMIGQKVLENTKVRLDSSSPAQLNIKNLATGNYVISIVANSTRINSLVVK